MLNDRIAEYLAAHNQPQTEIHKEWTPIKLSAPHDVPRVTMREIAADICDKYGLTLEELLSDRRTRRLSVPRQEFMFLANELPHTSLPMIGLFLGGRDHTTILHGVRAHKARLEQLSPTP